MTETVAASTAKKARKPKDGAKKAAVPTHPPTMHMVEKAIAAETSPKGVSVIAIKKYIESHYTVPANRLKSMLKRALEAGVKSGKLVRPHGQGSTGALSGRYRLASKAARPAVKAKTSAPAKKAAAPKTKAARKVPKPAASKPKTPKKKPATKPKAKSPKKVSKTPKKPAAKRAPVKKATKKAKKA